MKHFVTILLLSMSNLAWGMQLEVASLMVKRSLRCTLLCVTPKGRPLGLKRGRFDVVSFGMGHIMGEDDGFDDGYVKGKKEEHISLLREFYWDVLCFHQTEKFSEIVQKKKQIYGEVILADLRMQLEKNRSAQNGWLVGKQKKQRLEQEEIHINAEIDWLEKDMIKSTIEALD